MVKYYAALAGIGLSWCLVLIAQSRVLEAILLILLIIAIVIPSIIKYKRVNT